MASCPLCLAWDNLKTYLTVLHTFSGKSEGCSLKCRIGAGLQEREARVDSRESGDIHEEMVFFFFLVPTWNYNVDR